jgi:hypothetical protein
MPKGDAPGDLGDMGTGARAGGRAEVLHADLRREKRLTPKVPTVRPARHVRAANSRKFLLHAVAWIGRDRVRGRSRQTIAAGQDPGDVRRDLSGIRADLIGEDDRHRVPGHIAADCSENVATCSFVVAAELAVRSPGDHEVRAGHDWPAAEPDAPRLERRRCSAHARDSHDHEDEREKRSPPKKANGRTGTVARSNNKRLKHSDLPCRNGACRRATLTPIRFTRDPDDIPALPRSRAPMPLRIIERADVVHTGHLT